MAFEPVLPKAGSTSQPATGLKLHELPDDALLRIFMFLGSSPPRRASLFAPSGANDGGSSAAALAAAHPRLARLNVRCVELSLAQSSCCWPDALVKYPFAHSAFLDSLPAGLVKSTFCVAGAEALGRLRVLHVTDVPNDAFADRIAAGVPGLRELEVDGRTCSERGLARLLVLLPEGLRRLRVVYPDVSLPCAHGQADVHEAMWKCVGNMKTLKELELFCVPVLPKSALAALQKCLALRRVTVDVLCWLTSHEVPPAEFVAALPPPLTYLRLCCRDDDLRDPIEPLLLTQGCFAQLTRLESLHLSLLDFQNWKLLEPLALKVRVLSLRNGRIVGGDTLPNLSLLEELSLHDVEGVDDNVVSRLLRKFGSLRKLAISSSLDGLTDAGMASSLRGAACSETLSVLELGRRRSREGFGDETAAAISKKCELLEEVTFCSAHITGTGLTFLGRGCRALKKLALPACENVDDDAAYVIADLLPHLEKLDLSFTSISKVGLKTLIPDPRRLVGTVEPCSGGYLSGPLVDALRGRGSGWSGCEQLIELKLFGCRKITSAAVEAINNWSPIVSQDYETPVYDFEQRKRIERRNSQPAQVSSGAILIPCPATSARRTRTPFVLPDA